jgi:glyoxylase-like metal-dependent hydrolase (beta-lactamase superfamily II)
LARRQEQEAARNDVTEVAPRVLRMELPIRVPGLGHVNCYALIDDEGAALVDPGLPGPGTWRAIQARLRLADLKVRQVHTIIVTHSHPDHFGGAVRLAKESGAKVVAHRSFGFVPFGAPDDEPEVSVDDLAAQRDTPADTADPPASPLDQPSPWGGSRLPLPMRLRWRIRRWMSGGGFVPEVTDPVQQGDTLRLGGREWLVLHTPGHTGDHICLHDREAGTFLAGDHVLPTITPHISGMTSEPDPLKSFFDSLDRVGEIEGVERVLPAHGHPFTDLGGRAEAIKRHHHERLDKVKNISRGLGRPATVMQFSRKLFAARSWGSMAESETYAHLEHLRHTGEAERHVDEHGNLVYLTG